MPCCVAVNCSNQQDDGMFVAEFIDVSQLNSSPSNEDDEDLLTACECLVNTKTETVLDSVELNSLYYLAGYIVTSIRTNETTCDVCIESLQLNSDEEHVDSVVTQLVRLKEFVPGCLVSCGQAVFD